MTNRTALPLRLLLAASCAAVPLVSAHAQEPSPPDRRSEAHQSAHDRPDSAEPIVVTGHPPIDFGLLSSTASLQGDALTAQTRGQIGEILATLPGVSATSFSPGASRPVLRGFDGDRIRVLVDGIGAIDASSVSADHAVVLDPLTVDHIDVLHGPAVLLFGGQAIGGAVNALDKRIPREVPDAPRVTALAGYGSAADERSAAASVDIPVAPRLVAHIDANWRKSDDLRTGGFLNSPALRSELLTDAAEHNEHGEAEEAAELSELANARGRLPNSGTRSYTLGAGLAFIDSGGNLGVSVQHFDSRYGVPLRPGFGHDHAEDEHDDHDHDHEEESGHDHGEAPVSIALVQTRVDLRGAINLGGTFDSLQFRGGYGDYRHIEFEGDERGTRFAGNGLEFRTDLVQRDVNGWRGRSGFQVFTRKMTIEGSEAFVPNNQIDRFGLFTLQSIKLGQGFELEGAGRYEHASVKAQIVGFDRAFNLWSGAAGISYRPSAEIKIGANYVRGARAPAPEELLSDGMHVATQSYELGDPTFRAETSNGFEAYVRYNASKASLSVTGFMTDFDDFIAAMPTGDEQEGLPVFQYAQLPARFIGFEASGDLTMAEWADGSLRIDASADYTRARLRNIGPVPRIPPLRLRGGAELTQGDLRLRGEVEWNARQDRVAASENAVPGFTLVNLSADWHPMGEDGPLTLLLAANNIFDVAARRAASFTRDFVALPGRDLRVTAKVDF